MERPIIGVIPLWDEEKDSIWMLPGYMQGMEEAGAVPVILPLTVSENVLKKTADLCDGFLFTGGHDVNPKYELMGKKRIEVNCTHMGVNHGFSTIWMMRGF